MKKLTTLLTILTMCITITTYSLPVLAAEETPIKVYIENELVKFEKNPFIENDVTLVQFRPIFEKLGLKIEWDEKTKTVTGKRSDLIVKLVIDSTSAVINDEKKELVIAPRIIDGNTMVPLRFVSESSGKKVNWDGDTREIWVGEKGLTNVSSDNKPETPKTTDVKTIHGYNLTDEQIKSAIATGKKEFIELNNFINTNYTLQIIEDKLKILQPNIRFLTPYVNIAVTSYSVNQKLGVYSVEDAKNYLKDLEYVVFDVDAVGDDINFTSLVDVVLKQGDTIIKPINSDWKNEFAKTSSSWPKFPAYKSSFLVLFDKKKVDFYKDTELVYIYIGKDHSITYKVDLNKM